MPDTRTYADRADYLKKAVAARRRKLRDMAIEYGGSKCFVCGYNRSKRALVFHHLNPRLKDFGLSMRGLTRSWEKMRAELDKCVLLCANCHSEVHDGITQLPKVISVEKRGEFGETLARKAAFQKKLHSDFLKPSAKKISARGQSRAEPRR